MLNTRFAMVLVLVAIVLLAGCRIERNTWQEEPTPAAPSAVSGEAPAPAPRPAPVIDLETGHKRIVLFAPTDIGPLSEFYPEAKLDFPHEMAQRIDLLVRDADGRVGELLPSSEDPRWDKGRVGATYGSHLVVLTRVLSLKSLRGSGGAGGQTDRVVAFAEMRAFDADGKLVFTKKASGESAVVQSPKTLSASAKPESRAAWHAIDHAFGVLRRFVAEREDLSGVPNRASQDPLPTPAPQVEVVIDTDPARADILIDGQYRGTTPQTIPLPTRPVTVRLERQGYQVWERQITPSAGMRIQPALEPLAGTAAPAPAPAPAPVQPAPEQAPGASAEPVPQVPAPVDGAPAQMVPLAPAASEATPAADAPAPSVAP